MYLFCFVKHYYTIDIKIIISWIYTKFNIYIYIYMHFIYVYL